MRFKATWISLLLFLAATLVFASEFNADRMDEALERAKEYEKQIALPDVINFEGQKAAEQAAGLFHSPAYRKRIRAEIKRLKSEAFGELLKGYKKPDPAESASSVLPLDERIYIFISSSVPLTTLRTYAAELDKLNDSRVSMVIRGFVDGMKYFKPTLKLVQEMLVTDAACDLSVETCEAYHAAISIDPLVFRKYGIERVPAIAYVTEISLQEAAMSAEDVGHPEGRQDAYIVYGDVSLESALETIAKNTKRDGLYKLTKKLREGFYAK